ncbi:undecaprenyl-diphosphate phosphatase [Paenibacillus pasadenensis]|uniref:Undecaprenyl-diphosphatase n=1 Tax=Paenibacillus pasadenensis TaxID=217090 RepID=A0A2N5N6U3_9BACL|nr:MULTISPECIES: undecaprenyl-diphosphate phosphatase [Paenibacillus]PLT46076.1 Undecaprenyl-diphosphatase [Paenibacillus pasadenensis]QGG56551.1 undecaprenyl-diphosphate phosphatase [Paenibacillus sp. B01]
MDYIKAVVLGIIEGLTEFLPVSSTGHMILAGDLMNFTGDKAGTFEVVVQLGAVLAVFVLYFKRFISFLKFDFSKGSGLNALHIVLGMIPAGVLGVVLHGFIKEHLFGPTTVLLALIAGGLLMIAAEQYQKRHVPSAETVDDITYKQAFGIGVFQILALWSGFSRSGSTISGGIFMGTSQKAAADFTFILSVPMMFGATGVDLYKSRDLLVREDYGLLLVGLVVSFIVGLIAVVTFINLIKKLKLSWFAYYRFVLAALFFLFVM